MKTRVIFALLTFLLVPSCAFGPKMQQIDPGMNEAQVIQLLGQPDGLITDGDYRALQWADRMMDSWNNARADYWVIFEANRIVAYGPGEVRPGQRPQTLMLLPIQMPR